MIRRGTAAASNSIKLGLPKLPDWLKLKASSMTIYRLPLVIMEKIVGTSRSYQKDVCGIDIWRGVAVLMLFDHILGIKCHQFDNIIVALKDLTSS